MCVAQNCRCTELFYSRVAELVLLATLGWSPAQN